MHAMSKREIHGLINDFIEAAVRCQKAGVDCVELHAGHGYLLQQFLSPHILGQCEIIFQCVQALRLIRIARAQYTLKSQNRLPARRR